MTRLTPLTAALVFLIAAAGFALSYNALYQYAYANGINAGLTWLWPLVIDGFMIVISLSILRASLYQEPVKYLWVLAILATVVSIVFNVAHAPATLAGRAVATVPPVAMFAAFEVFIGQVRRNSQRVMLQESLSGLQERVKDTEIEGMALRDENESIEETVSHRKAELKLLQGEIKKAQRELIELQSGDTRGKLAMYYLQYPAASQDDAAQAVGISRARVGQLLKDIRGSNGKATHETT